MPAKKDQAEVPADDKDVDHDASHEKDQPEAARLPESAQALVEDDA